MGTKRPNWVQNVRAYETTGNSEVRVPFFGLYGKW